MSNALSLGRCAEFVSRVLKELGVTATINDLFKAVKEQPVDSRGFGGFGRDANAPYPAQAGGSIDHRNPAITYKGKIHLGSVNEFGGSAKSINNSNGRIVIHELLHIAGKGFDHYDMAKAGYRVATVMNLKMGNELSDSDPRGPDWKNGMEFGKVMDQECMAR